jgi:hypothetical protein
LPALVLNNSYAVATIAARDALTPAPGDVAIVADDGTGVSRSYVWDGIGSTWLELLSPLSLNLIKANNLSDIANTAIARTNLGLGATDSPTFTGLTLAGGALAIDSLGKINGVYLLPASDGTSGQVLTTNGSGLVSWANAGSGSSQWTTSGSGLDIYYNSGNVGIGTTDPDSNLNIHPASGDAGMTIESNNGNAFTTFKSDTADNASSLLLKNNDNASITFGIAGTNYGTANGDASMNNLALIQANDGDTIPLSGLAIEATGDVPIYFSTNGSMQMIISPEGNVGIGTITPSAPLHVVASDYLSKLETSQTGDRTMQQYVRQGTPAWDFNLDGDGTLEYYSDLGGGTGLSIDALTGNVGIGQIGAGAKLEVNGGIRLNTTDSKPTCNVSTRGTTWFTQGEAGVKDSFEVCAKSAEDAYAWRTMY